MGKINRRRSFRPRSFSSRDFRRKGGLRNKRISRDKYVSTASQTKSNNLYAKNDLFDNLPLSPVLLRNIKSNNYIHPTQIQIQTINHIQAGKDVLGLAQTGSGKTGAFLIPLIDKVIKDQRERVLIISPTRELAEQTRKELFALSTGTSIKSVLAIGGTNIRQQISYLRKNPTFVIGTPGRLKDLENRRSINLTMLNNIVLDEVDRMLDMGFIRDIKYLISKLPENKQSLFFSATMPSTAEHVAKQLMKDPVRVQTEQQAPQQNVNQNIIRVNSNMEKTKKLVELLQDEEFQKVLVFSRTKRRTDKLHKELQQNGFNVDAIHGDKSQFIRTKVINKFRDNNIKILVATDVAARGLDVKDITHVINYDEPATYNDYIHRIGRTGRVGKTGKALTFVI